MRALLVSLALSLAVPAGTAFADKAPPPVCKTRFEGTYTNGVRAEADAPDEAAARKIFEAYAAEQNQIKPPKGAPSPTKPTVFALDRVRRLADNCTGLQSFLVFN